jgi:hypothetical protein
MKNIEWMNNSDLVYEGKTICRVIDLNNPQTNLAFYSNDSEYLQVATWRYSSGKVLDRHIHNLVDRKINRTHEVVLCIKGQIEVMIYSLDEELISTFVLEENHLVIMMDCGHGYRILTDDTKALEIKNGPYYGAEIDRRRF